MYELAAGNYRAGAVSFSRQVTLPDVPDAPVDLEAEAGDAQVELTWETPADNGSPLTGYEYRQSSDGGGTWSPDWGPVPGSDGSTTRHTVRDLTNGLEYSFEVRAVNGAGEGASASDTATPARPDTRGRVEWSTTQPRVGQELTPTLIDPDAPALAEARWRWRRQRWSRSDAGDSLSAPAPESRSGESKLAVIARTRQYRPRVSDLNQWLWVEVTYTDDFDRHRVSATASRAVGPGPPCAPANLKAKPGDGQVTLTWEAGCDNGGTIDRYQYRRPEAVKWVRVAGDGSARRQQVEGLTNGEAHTFEVRARNGQGWGPSAQATATPEAERTVSFAAAAYQASEGGEAATVRVRLSRAASYVLRIPIAVNPPSGDFTVAGLTDGGLSFSSGAERQTFTVTADQDDDWDDERVSLGFGTLPTEVVAGTQATATVTLFDDDVGPPTEVTVTAASTGGHEQLEVGWTAPSTSVTGYEVQYRVSGTPEWTGHPVSGTGTSTAISGLQPDTVYQVQVRSVKGEVRSVWAAGSGRTASRPVDPDPVGPPGAPRDVRASAGNGQVTLSWTAAASNGSSITRYDTRYNAGAGRNWSEWSAVPGGGPARSHPVRGLDNGTEYGFQVRAVNGRGEGPAAGVNATPVAPPPDPVGPPGAPGSLSASAGNGQVTLSWTAAASNGSSITRYDTRYNAGAGRNWSDWSAVPGGGPARSHPVRGLDNGTEYGFQVRAVNGRGEGPAAGVNATPSSAAAKALAEQLLAANGMKGLAALAAPNPFNPSTTIYFQVQESEQVSLVIYSLAGQVVRKLIPGRALKAGIHEVYWEGDDQQGRPVAAGVYFYRLIAGDQALVRKMTLLR